MAVNVIFMGTPDFAVPTLQRLIDSDAYQVTAVVTQPDKARGRHKALVPSPVKACALSHDIPVLQPVRARDPEFVSQLEALAPDVIVVVAFGQILPKSILELPPFGCINVHASLLPKYRGAAPIQWAVINGEAMSGVTTMMMGEGLDTGDMLMQRAIPLAPDETGGSLHDKLCELGADLLIETLDAVRAGTQTRQPQDDAQAGAYAKMMTKELGHLDLTADAVRLERLIRGLNPWPSAYVLLNDKTLKLWSARVLADPAGSVPAVPGTVTAVDPEGIVVQTGSGRLLIREVQLEGKKRMEAAAFVRGYSLPVGTVLR